jgi:bifunctional non-homologous end joining protein LigD
MPARKAPQPAEPASALARYWAKRDFGKTSEPRGDVAASAAGTLSFIIQKHWASRLHYDVRLAQCF